MGDTKHRAGEAFAAAIQDDPEAQAALARAHLRLAAFGATTDQLAAARATAVAQIDQCLSLLREAQRAGDAERSEAMETLARELTANCSEWEATYGEAYPRELDDWIRQATRAGVDPNAIDSATLADLAPKIEGHLLRLRDQAQTKPNAMLVQAMLIARMERGEPFTSFRALVKELHQQLPGASLSMVRSAIDRSRALTEWKKAGLRHRDRQGRAEPLTEVRLETLPAPASGDSNAIDAGLDRADNDAIWAKLLDAATPEDRARLNAMSEVDRSEVLALHRQQLADDRRAQRKARPRG